MTSEHSQRKNEHLSLAVKQWRQGHNPINGASFEDVRWVPDSLPELAVTEINYHTAIGPLDLDWPFYIEAMTGGSDYTRLINQQLATVAREHHLAMAIGSQSVALKDPSLCDSFEIVRKTNPDGIIIANLGANHPIEHVRMAINMLGANAIELHVNVAQELSMAEGDRAFYWLDNLATVIAKSPVPVIIKEVGFGMSAASLTQIASLKPTAINVGGSNGTNFALIEQKRDRQNQNHIDLSHYGFSTVESLLAAQKAQIEIPVIATGGITSPNDVITSLMLGAQVTSSAGYFLTTLLKSGLTGLNQTVSEWQAALPKLMTLLGAKDITALQNCQRIYSPTLTNFLNQI